MKESVEWLSKVEDIPTASEAMLKRALLTDDGRGAEFKEKCLNELLKRLHWEP